MVLVFTASCKKHQGIFNDGPASRLPPVAARLLDEVRIRACVMCKIHHRMRSTFKNLATRVDEKMRKVLLPVGIFVAVTVFPVTISHAQNVETGKPHANALQHKEDLLPTVDYDKADSTDAHQRARRNARGKRHDGSLRVGEPHPESGAKGILDSWMQKVPALPTVISDAIIIGEISDAQAYLSPDKTGIYSEYTARVEQVVKQYAKAPISVNGVVDSQREGGRVRFPSGRVQSYITHYQGVP